MTKQYTVKASYTFEVEWLINAESSTEAKTFVEQDCHVIRPEIISGLPDEVIEDWYSNHQPKEKRILTCTLGKSENLSL